MSILHLSSIIYHLSFNKITTFVLLPIKSMKNIIILSASLTILFACSDNKSTDKESTVPPAEEMVNDGVMPPPAEPVAGTPQATELQVTPQPAAGAPPATGSVAPAGSMPASTSTEAMNPPHGQPGHRCDIAVGAPLSSPPGTGNAAPVVNPVTTPSGNTKLPTANNPSVSEKVIFQPDPNATGAGTISTTPAPQAPAPAAGPIVTAPGMNPPHGEPGHDCGVAVGAPLPKK